MKGNRALISETEEHNSLIPLEGIIQKPNGSIRPTWENAPDSGMGNGNLLQIPNGEIEH